MGEKTSVDAARGRTKLRIQLTDDEYAELRRAVRESEFPNMALLIFQAIHEGLQGDEAVGLQKRTKSATIHTSREFKQKIQATARMQQVTQQALLRNLLIQYIRNKPWLSARAEKTEGT